MIYKMELSDSVDDMIFELLEVPIEDKDVTGIADNTTIDGNVFRDYLWLKKQWTQKWSIMCQDEYNRLRGFWLRQFGNAEVPFYRLFYGDNVYEDKNTFTVNGFVQIENDAPLYSPLSLTHLYGNATQKTLSGKNLLSITQSSTINMGTYVSGANTNEYKIKATGNDIFVNTASGVGVTWDSSRGNLISCNYGETIYFSVGNNNFQKNYFTEWDENMVSLGYTLVSSSSGTYTPTRQDCKYVVFRFGFGYSVPDTTYTLSPIVCKTSDTSYEPYTGGSPMPNPQFPSPVNVVSGGQFIKVTKKNLLPTAGDWTQNVNGLVVSCSDGVYKLQGKATSGNSTNIYRLKEPYTVQTGDYLHLGNPTTDSHSNVQFFFDDGDNNTIIASPYGGTNRIISLDQYAGRTLSRVRCNFNANYDLDVELKPMILHNVSTASDYEPYESQMQTINLGGINLFNVNDIEGGQTQNMTVDSDGWLTCTIDNSGGSGSQYGLWLTNNLTALKTSTYYAIVMEVKNVSGSGSVYPTQGSGANCQFTSNIGVNFSSISSGNTYVYTQITKADFSNTYQGLRTVVAFSAGQSGSITFRLSVLTDTTMTPRRFWYLPYTTYAYELAKVGNYQDYIWNDDGTWKIHKEVRHISLAIADMDNDATGNYPGWKNVPHLRDDIGVGVNSSLDSRTDWSSNITQETIRVGINTTNTGSTLFLNRREDGVFGLLTQNEIQATYPNLIMELYYGILEENQTDTEITDSDLIEQLDHIYSLYGGVNNIMLIPSGGAQGEIAVKYRLNYEEETDIVPRTPVVLTLTDGGVINPCGCRENIQLVMRETEGGSES